MAQVAASVPYGVYRLAGGEVRGVDSASVFMTAGSWWLASSAFKHFLGKAFRSAKVRYSSMGEEGRTDMKNMLALDVGEGAVVAGLTWGAVLTLTLMGYYSSSEGDVGEMEGGWEELNWMRVVEGCGGVRSSWIVALIACFVSIIEGVSAGVLFKVANGEEVEGWVKGVAWGGPVVAGVATAGVGHGGCGWVMGGVGGLTVGMVGAGISALGGLGGA
ncbi:hypothetical protein TrRE_jg10248 [Triparma retinervis]|uniref:Uncharacterized protein n=1 Tax=Triparma retinervis TaxID=2557542 RepID=A0A9W7FW12_9STRA|nr:hypothetical protein TrRE_jg10248 [Triparma retinervis]